jgi:PAS domain S-box-containing protein
MDSAERAVLASLGGNVVAVTQDNVILFASPEACQFLGWTQLEGRPLVSIVPPYLRRRHVEGFRRYVESGESRLQGKAVRVPALTQEGKQVDVELAIRVFKRPDGTKLAVATLNKPGEGEGELLVIEDAMARRMYELV